MPEVKNDISWLLLEQLHLGELPANQAESVRRSVEADADLARRLAGITQDNRPIPALRLPERRRYRLWRQVATAFARPVTWMSSASLILVLIVFAVSQSPTLLREAPWQAPPSRLFVGDSSIKGNEIAIRVLRQRHGVLSPDAHTFIRDDSFKLLITCSPSQPHRHIVSVQGNVVSALFHSDEIHCGNEQVVPGAFRIDGMQPMSICFSTRPIITSRADLGQDSVCVSLTPE